MNFKEVEQKQNPLVFFFPNTGFGKFLSEEKKKIFFFFRILDLRVEQKEQTTFIFIIQNV